MHGHPWRRSAALLLVASALAPGCATLENLGWTSNERAKPIDDDAGETSLPAILGEKPVFHVDSVAIARDIETALAAAASGDSGAASSEEVEAILAQIRREAEEHLNGLAANSDAIVYVDPERAASQSTLTFRCTIDVLRVVDDTQPADAHDGRSLRRLIDGSTLADVPFECAVTLTAIENGALVAMQRSEGVYEPDLPARKPDEPAPAAPAVEPAPMAPVLSAPAKSALKRALNGAWTELWDAYAQRLERARRASEAYRSQPPAPEGDTPR